MMIIQQLQNIILSSVLIYESSHNTSQLSCDPTSETGLKYFKMNQSATTPMLLLMDQYEQSNRVIR